VTNIGGVPSTPTPNRPTTIGIAEPDMDSAPEQSPGTPSPSLAPYYGDIFWVFRWCPSLLSIDVHPDNSVFRSQEGVLLTKDDDTLILCPAGKTGAYAVPDGVTVINSYAFFFCARLKSVTIPSSVDQIHYAAFIGCSGLKRAFFLGDAPPDYEPVQIFPQDIYWTFGGDDTLYLGSSKLTVYYFSGTRGWGDTFSSRPTVMIPQIGAGTERQILNFALPPRIVYGSSYILKARASSGLDIDYTVSDPSVALVDGAKRLSILKTAPFTITATQGGDFLTAPASKTLQVNPERRPQRIAMTARTTMRGGDVAGLLVSQNSPLPVAVTSSDPDIVRVDADFTVTAIRRGVAVLTASQAGNENYAPAKAVKKRVVVK
jgi:hypothetical protein